jgi:hypothetical protein
MGRKQRRKATARETRPAPRGGGRWRTLALLAVVAAAVALVVASWQGESPPREATPAAKAPRAAARTPSSDPAPPRAARRTEPGEAAEAPARFRPLLGEWVRPDGGYVLSVTGITEEGAATVAYLNPRPINVERAEVREEGDVVGLFVELRDRGYPGSTYTLAHDAQADQLKGLYFQAAQRATYDVVFVRR